MTIEKVEFYHRDEDGILRRITVSPDNFDLILKYAKDLNALYDFLKQLGKWEKLEDEPETV